MTLRVAAAALSMLVPLCTMAQGTSKQIPARVEMHPIQTLTLSDEQFLKGATDGKAVTVSGKLSIAQGQRATPRRHPGARLWRCRRQYRHVDPRTERDRHFDICARRIYRARSRRREHDQALLGRLNLALDAYRALAILARHPRVDPRASR